jgi:hypothetical protein
MKIIMEREKCRSRLPDDQKEKFAKFLFFVIEKNNDKIITIKITIC